MTGTAGRSWWVAVAVGVVVVVAALLWRPIVVPQLADFPRHLDQTTDYAGTFTAYVDPATGRPLAEPVELPLEIERRIVTIPEESDGRRVVVQERVAYLIGGEGGTEQREAHQYVMHRRTMENRDDPRSWAYDEANVVDREGTYRVNLPLGTHPGGRYPIWSNETGRGTEATVLPDRVDRHGMSLVEMVEVYDDVPVADYYRDDLRAQGFPLEVGFDELGARVSSSGVDVEAALAALPAADQATVAAARDTVLPLRYTRSNDGSALVEPDTGAIVELLVSREAIASTVDLEPIAELREALDRSSADPAVAALAGALDDLGTAPPDPVYALDYSELPSSAAETAELAADEAEKLAWVEERIPVAIGMVGLALIGVGAIGLRRRASHHGHGSGDAGEPEPSEPAEPVEPVEGADGRAPHLHTTPN